MATRPYVALLRGINVGGNNLVPMAALRATIEDAGFEDVSTYIQSGNVLFQSSAPRASLEGQVEAAIEERFEIPILVVVVSHAELRDIVRDAPEGFGQQPDVHHSDVVFLKRPLTSRKAMGIVKLREGVDAAWAGKRVVYFQRLSAHRTKSLMGKIVGTPEYKQMTIRSWKTTTKLLAMLEARPDP